MEHGDGRGLFAAGLKETFVVDLARAGGLGLTFENRQIAALSLAGSSDAIESVRQCQAINGSRAKDSPTRAASAEPNPPKAKGSQGTGFFVSEHGHVMTNQHVIAGCETIDVVQVGRPPVRARLVASDSTNDLAVVSTDLRPAAVPALSMRARTGETVYVYGFPLSGLLATTGNFTIGNVTATAGLNDDTRMIQISAPVQPGNSGGPLVDQHGNVVGVIVAKLNALKLAKLTDDVAQNVNFAIKTTIALNFLEANGIAAPLERATASMSGAEIAERAKDFTVRINCQ